MFDVIPSPPSAGARKGRVDSLQELQRAHAQMLSALNHEIRTPLTGILGMADLLLESVLTSEQREYVESTRACAESLLESLSHALEYASVMAGQLELADAPFHLSEVVRTSVSSLRERAAGRGIQLHLLSDPAEDGALDVVAGDAVRLRQVFSILLAHAIDACVQAEVRVAVSTFCIEPDRQLILSVSVEDHGPDQAPERVAQLFETPDRTLFAQARLELGLPLASRLVQAMGGHLEAEAIPGAGTLYTLTLPLRITDAAPEPAPRPAIASKLRPRILLVEDNEVAQRFMKTVMERKRYDVDVAGSGMEALSAVEACEYDLILMDVQMPDMDGLECTRRIRRLAGGRRVPIIACTANTAYEVRNSCLEAGMNDFLAKPVHTAELVEVVAKYLPAD